MEQRPSWEVKSSSATQEIPHFLRKPKIYYRTQKPATCLYP